MRAPTLATLCAALPPKGGAALLGAALRCGNSRAKRVTHG